MDTSKWTKSGPGLESLSNSIITFKAGPGSGAGYRTYWYATYSIPYQQFIIETYMKLPVNQEEYGLAYSDKHTGLYVQGRTRYGNDGFVYEFATQPHNEIGTLTSHDSNFHLWRLERIENDIAKVSVFVSGVQYSKSSTNCPKADSYAVYYGIHNTQFADHFNADWVRVRKYTSPEPTFTISAEYPAAAPTPTITPTPASSTPPTGKIKAVWLYDHDKCDITTLMTDLKSAGIDTVFVSTDVNNIWKYERFVKAAHENGIETHAMILELSGTDYVNFYNDQNHKDKAVSDVKKVLDYNEKSLASFDGINIDMEPYTGDLWNSDRTAVWNDYIEVLKAIHDETAGKTVVSVDIPRWYDEAKIKDLALNLDFFVIMAYDSGDAGWNTVSEIEDVVASEMGAIRGEGSKAVIGVGVHEGFEDKGTVEKCADELYKYYSDDSTFLGVSIFKYGSYSGLSGASEVPTEEIPEIPTGEEKGIPGFEAIFAITGLLMVVYVLRRWGRL